MRLTDIREQVTRWKVRGGGGGGGVCVCVCVCVCVRACVRALRICGWVSWWVRGCACVRVRVCVQGRGGAAVNVLRYWRVLSGTALAAPKHHRFNRQVSENSIPSQYFQGSDEQEEGHQLLQRATLEAWRVEDEVRQLETNTLGPCPQ